MASELAAVLEAKSLTTGYDQVPIVRDVDVVFTRGAITAIIGTNGAGKSTVVKALVGVLPAWSGEVRLDGRDITKMPAHLRVREGIAYVPQGRIVFPEMTVLENLELGGFTLAGERAKLAQNLARVLQMFPRLAERRTQLAGTMSGGEQQMLAIGRALMSSPRVIALDEPSLGLSPKFVEMVFATLVELKKAGYTIVMVEQKASRALEISDWGYVMHLGRVAFEGPAGRLRDDDQVKRAYLGELPPELEARFAQTETT
jgi:branched-chain amino acid transport system ATP-binding protein